MQIPKMQANKVKQAIRRHGVEYHFVRAKTDNFGQPILNDDGNPLTDTEISVKGIFHESSSHFALLTNEAAQVQTKPKPAIMAMWDSVKNVSVNDQLTVPPNGSMRYKVAAVNDIGSIQLFADISLEVIADGSQF